MGASSHPADFPKSASVPISPFWLLPNSPSVCSCFRYMPPTLVSRALSSSEDTGHWVRAHPNAVCSYFTLVTSAYTSFLSQ